jgi:hypothetical protein
MAMQRVGVPPTAIHTMLRSIQTMELRVATSYGISDQRITLQSPPNQPTVHSIGQGNGAGPAVWAVLSSPLLNYMRLQDQTLQIPRPLTAAQTSIFGFAFVDDTDIVRDSKDPAELQSIMQQAVTTWLYILEATGGALEPAKSFWYAVAWRIEKGTWKMYTPQLDTPVMLPDLEGRTTDLALVPHNEARRTLGVHLCPAGDVRKQAMLLATQSQAWVTTITQAKLTQSLAWVAYNTRISRQWSYIVPTIKLSPSQWHNIQSPVIRALLAGLRVSRSFPRAIVHAPATAGGLGIPDYEIMQGILKLCIFRNIAPFDSITAQILQASMEMLQFQCGLTNNILNLPYNHWQSSVTKGWLTELWEFCNQYQITIEAPPLSLEPPRSNNTPLMAALSTMELDSSQLAAINQVQLNCGIFWISEIANLEGTQLLPAVQFGMISHKKTWPWVDPPKESDHTLWKATLSRLTTTENILQEPLGPFTSEHHKWWYSPSQNSIFCMHNGWTQHTLIQGGRQTWQTPFKFSTEGFTREPPPGLQ